jgi:hypothetical protein
MYWRILILVLLATTSATTAHAGIIFKKKPKPDPAQRVPELIGLVKTSTDESERSDAAEELRKYEPEAFPDIIPTLLEALQNDPKPSVRIAALTTLAKLRPVTQEVGMALEQALAKDSSVRVRLQARSALLGYHWAGYRTPKKDEKGPTPPPTTTKEPPLAPPPGTPLEPLPTGGPDLVPPPTTGSQPLTPPTPLPPPMSAESRRMPVGPRVPEPLFPRRKPAVPPVPVSTPTPKQGPDLGAPY